MEPLDRKRATALLAITVAGTVTDEILAAYDWFPTLASLVGNPSRSPPRNGT
jgi:hypothetical protein